MCLSECLCVRECVLGNSRRKRIAAAAASRCLSTTFGHLGEMKTWNPPSQSCKVTWGKGEEEEDACRMCGRVQPGRERGMEEEEILEIIINYML